MKQLKSLLNNQPTFAKVSALMTDKNGDAFDSLKIAINTILVNISTPEREGYELRYKNVPLMRFYERGLIELCPIFKFTPGILIRLNMFMPKNVQIIEKGANGITFKSIKHLNNKQTGINGESHPLNFIWWRSDWPENYIHSHHFLETGEYVNSIYAETYKKLGPNWQEMSRAICNNGFGDETLDFGNEYDSRPIDIVLVDKSMRKLCDLSKTDYAVIIEYSDFGDNIYLFDKKEYNNLQTQYADFIAEVED
jgi:hypothetical protein